MTDETEDENYEGWLVVLNHEEQYSVWDEYDPVPKGWRKEGFRGKKKACLEHIEKVWTDMRPKSLRDYMEALPEEEKFKGINHEFVKELEAARLKAEPGVNQFRKARPPNDLVKRLMVEQDVEIIRYRDRETGKPDIRQLKRAIDLGGTELGANLRNNDGTFCQDSIVWDDKTNQLTVKGRCKLDYCPVEVFAVVDLTTFKGTGKLTEVPDFDIPRDY